ncbi:T9SS type A sorting domain-containing protein [Dyadobacter sp. SG02]|uniref:T9SS type A sorting domain-containing protein n=1 Tax=Dyadobacter sp. SG02 TaxID=1855291 RepID=UPI000B86F4D3|nr:T9SS type A sorting domain-containing protein [Dyadobacter sp. SG02]
MIKRYLFFCHFALLPALSAQAQFTAGAEGLFIAQDTQVSIDSLTLEPSAGFSLASQTLTISHIPVPGVPPSIRRVYSFTTPVDFAGIMGFFFQPAELNGNNESTLQLAHGNTNFVSVAGSTVDITRHYISNTLPLTNFTSLTAAQEDALPVRLIGFEVKRLENRTVLSWRTSEEENSDYFEIQQSEDSRNWAALGTVKAASESVTLREYTFNDLVQRYGTQYYRLKMVDKDGSFAYSTIRHLRFEDPAVISAYPNPVVDKLRIGSNEALARVTMTDLTGRLVLELTKPEPGQEFSLKNYPAGMYLIQVKTATGRSQAIKIIKQ